jgi:hypothetical protein
MPRSTQALRPMLLSGQVTSLLFAGRSAAISPIPSCALARTARPFTAVYRPRRPEKIVVYQVVQQHLETWLAQAREADPDSDPIPRFVERICAIALQIVLRIRS